MAFSALSMAHSTGIQNLDALQHYQQALPSLQYSLQSPSDLSSDGTLLTHFILLLYEVSESYARTPSILFDSWRRLQLQSQGTPIFGRNI